MKPYNFKLDIIFEDNDLIVLNKPAGIVMHPGAGNFDNTIVNALINMTKILFQILEMSLDQGLFIELIKTLLVLVVIAKNNKTHEHLSIQFNEHSINRTYQLLIWGKIRPSKGKIETLITRSSKIDN